MYEHLKNNPPLMVAEAMKFLGLKEIKGKVNNKTILGWANEIGGKLADIYKSDEIAWCGLFMAMLAFRGMYFETPVVTFKNVSPPM